MQNVNSVNFLTELYDLVLLQVPAQHLTGKQIRTSSTKPDRTSIQIGWVPNKDVSVDAVIADLLTDLSAAYPGVTFKSSSSSHDGMRLSTVVADVDIDIEETVKEPYVFPRDLETEPIPGEPNSTITLSLLGSDYVIQTHDGASFSVFRNSEEIASDLPSAAAALGAAMEFVLMDIADREGKKGTPDPDNAVDRDFLFFLGKYFADSTIVPDEQVRRYLIDFVELTTNREFSS
jgi:hypothetical protein